jgi:hypothetical protein
MADSEPRRSKLELASMLAYAILTFAFGVALTLGVPALLLYRAVVEGGTAWGLVSGVLGVAWAGVLAYAILRDRETRGWVAFALVGWVFYLRPLLRRVTGSEWRR